MDEFAATAAQIIQIGHVSSNPIPNVKIPTIVLITNMINAPETVEYNIPKGPKRNVSKIASPTLLPELTIITCFSMIA